jgi:hypothetical protein
MPKGIGGRSEEVRPPAGRRKSQNFQTNPQILTIPVSRGLQGESVLSRIPRSTWAKLHFHTARLRENTLRIRARLEPCRKTKLLRGFRPRSPRMGFHLTPVKLISFRHPRKHSASLPYTELDGVRRLCRQVECGPRWFSRQQALPTRHRLGNATCPIGKVLCFHSHRCPACRARNTAEAVP